MKSRVPSAGERVLRNAFVWRVYVKNVRPGFLHVSVFAQPGQECAEPFTWIGFDSPHESLSIQVAVIR